MNVECDSNFDESKELLRDVIKSALDFWKRFPKELDSADMLNDDLELARDQGIELLLRVKGRAFKKENIVTYFPEGMQKFGRVEENGDKVFDTYEDLSFSATEFGHQPYFLVYAGSCSLEAHFDPSDVESIVVKKD